MARKVPDKDQDIVDEALERFERAFEYQAAAHQHFIDDMKFCNADDENKYQWADSVSTSRTTANRPALTVNKTRVHCLQVINDARQNPVQVRINPVSDDASYEAAQIYEGIVRHIEYVSNAQAAYANATYCQVVGGIGYWRIMVDYEHDDTFDQEIYIKRVPDPTSVYMDPDIQQADGSDAKWAFFFYELSREEFQSEYGDGDDPDDPNLNNAPLSGAGGTMVNPRDRTDDKHVQVVEYWRVGEKDDKLLMMADGTVQRSSDLPPGQLEQMAQFGIMPIAERPIAVPKIEWFLIADNKIVQRKDWLGKYIPIVRVPCEEIVIDHKLDWVSHVRHLRDPQRLYNWYTSQAAEFVALQTKTPFIAVADAVEPYKEDWELANVENRSVLLYKGKDSQNEAIPPPQRAESPVMAPAYIEGLKIAQAEMMMASGQYQAIMGEPSNEISGKAINARQRQGDNATYHVIDRLASAIRFTGRIIIDLIPKVYNTKRVLMIMGEDGTQTQVQLDPNAPQATQTIPNPQQAQQGQLPMQAQPDPDVERAKAVQTIFNPNVGRYAVVADVGPSYATKRQEAFNAFSQVIAQQPNALQIIGDFWAKNADFPDADKMAARLKSGLPPQYQADAPDPEKQQLQATLKNTTETAQQLLQKADAETSQLKGHVAFLNDQAKDKSVELDIKRYEAETERLKVVGAIDQNALQLVVRQLLTDMLQTDILPALHGHSDLQGQLAARMAPPPPPPPADPNAMHPMMQAAHHAADLAQKQANIASTHADIANTHANTMAVLNPPESAEGEA